MLTKEKIALMALATIEVAVLVAGVYKLRKEDQAKALARAVTVLPRGTESAWAAYIDRRLAGAIQRRGDRVRIPVIPDAVVDKGNIDILDSNGTEISREVSYEVICLGWLLGTPAISVAFGEEDDSIGVAISGGPYMALMPVDPALKSEHAPPLGVDPDSIAAARLSKALCERATAYLEKVMTHGPAPIRPDGKLNF